MPQVDSYPSAGKVYSESEKLHHQTKLYLDNFWCSCAPINVEYSDIKV